MREVLAAVVKALDECPAQAVFGLSLDESVSCVDDIHRVIQQATAVQLALIRHVDTLQVAAAMGATGTVSWLRDRHRISGTASPARPPPGWSNSPEPWTRTPAHRRRRR